MFLQMAGDVHGAAKIYKDAVIVNPGDTQMLEGMARVFEVDAPPRTAQRRRIRMLWRFAPHVPLRKLSCTCAYSDLTINMAKPMSMQLCMRAVDQGLKKWLEKVRRLTTIPAPSQATEGPGAALAVYRRVVELEPNRPTVWCDIGRLLQERSNFGEAEEMYQNALDYDPRCLIALNSMGLISTHAGMPPSPYLGTLFIYGFFFFGVGFWLWLWLWCILARCTLVL